MTTITSNISAASASRNLSNANASVSDSIARLSSGNRITKASDDVAGLSIGTSINTTVKQLEIARLNTEQARSVLQIADGALSQVTDLITRSTALATQANSGSLSDTERGFLNQEFQALVSEIDRIVDNTNFNGITLLDGSLGASTGQTSGGVSDTFTYEASGSSTANATGATTVTDIAAFSNGTGAADGAGVIGNAFSTATVSVDIVNGAANEVSISISVGGETFTSGVADINTTSADFTFTSSTGASFDLTIDADATAGVNLADGYDAAADDVNLAAAIQADLRTVTSFFQQRALDATSTGIEASAFDGTIIEGLDGGDFLLTSDDFTVDGTSVLAPTISSFNVVAEDTTAGTNGSISVKIGDEVFSTSATEFDSSQLIDGTIVLYKDGLSTSSEQLSIAFDQSDATGNFAIDNTETAEALEKALNDGFGVGNNGALSFQVGSTVTDKIDVSISSSNTNKIFLDDSGVAKTLDISTQEGSITAVGVLDNAANTITSIRADIGAVQSRFNFAANNLEVSISNQTNARDGFLAANVAQESTEFATNQVRLQASVSVLAQANQLPQNLLQLLQ